MARTSLSADATKVASSSPPSSPPLKVARFTEFRLNRRPKGPSKAQFDRIFKNGIAERGRLLRVLCFPGQGLIGIAVAKKLGSHPVRNKLKRRCREAARGGIGQFLMERDYVLIAGLDASKASQIELASDLMAAISRINKREFPTKKDQEGKSGP